MKSWLGTVCAAGLLAGTVMGTGSCADNQNMLVIMGAMSAQPPDCTYTAAAGSLLLFNGILDRAFGGRYVAVLLVANELASEGDKSRLRAESSDVTIDNAVVNLLADGTAPTPSSPYSVPASGHVPVGSGQDIGYGAISVDLIPGLDGVGSDVHYLIAEVKLQGKTSGGVDIESNVFKYEIYLEDSGSGGGLVTFNEYSNGVGYCAVSQCGSSVTATSTLSYCYQGQDMPVSCCDCVTNPVCNAQ